MPPALKTGFGPFHDVQDWKNINTVRAFLNGERASTAEARQVNATVRPSPAGLREITISAGAIVGPASSLRVFSQ